MFRVTRFALSRNLHARKKNELLKSITRYEARKFSKEETVAFAGKTASHAVKMKSG
ncbi:MAG: hypothetical protein GY950_16435 [bacterium]|nr:hypothetical protein [bacterium]